MTILSGNARLAGITGWPVSHSRSPRLHGFWLERYGIDGAYVPLPIDPAHFPAAIRGLMLAGFAGVNVTIPHKVAAFAICDDGGLLRPPRRRCEHDGVRERPDRRQQHRRLGLPGKPPRARRRSGRRSGLDPRAPADRRARSRRCCWNSAFGSPWPTAPAPAPRLWRMTLPGLTRDRLGGSAITPCPTTRCWSTRRRSA